eukprot:scaffold595_cov53-Isochrysis_galbana.AAC.1
MLEGVERGYPDRRVPVAQVGQQRLDQLGRVGLHRLAAHQLDYRGQHLPPHQRDEGAGRLDDGWVRVTAGAQADCAEIVE